jgi:hypothetical protein
MPSATFYPATTSEPLSGEGAFINGVDPSAWVNPTTKFNQDYAITADAGSLTSPNVNTLPPATPPTATDARLTSQFAYSNIASASTTAQTKMARGIVLRRVSDNADLSTVIPATATGITNVTVSFRFADSSYGVNSTGGTGAAIYIIEAQQRNTSGAIGSTAIYTSLFDYASSGLYCYYVPSTLVFGSMPTIAQIRDANYGINFRLSASDVLETTPYIGVNGLRVDVTWTEPSTFTRIRPSRTRNNLVR